MSQDGRQHMQSSDICSHHIFCVGDATIPYARLSSLCLLLSCPQELRRSLRIYVHLDALKQDPAPVARWLQRTPGTTVTTGLFGIPHDEERPVKWYQAMVNTLSAEFAHEPVIAIVDADLFLTNEAWFKAAQTHQPEHDYSLACRFRGGRFLHHRGQSFRCIQTLLFTLTPAIHNEICDQRFANDVSAMEKLLEQFPEARVEMIQKLDCMVTSSFKAQLLGYQVREVGKECRLAHVGGFSYMGVSKLKAVDGPVHDRWLPRIPFHSRTGRLLRWFGWETSPGTSLDKWLARVRFNARMLQFFKQLGWEGWLDPTYSAKIEDVVKLVEGSNRLSKRQASLEPSRDETVFREHIEPRLDILREYS